MVYAPWTDFYPGNASEIHPATRQAIIIAQKYIFRAITGRSDMIRCACKLQSEWSGYEWMEARFAGMLELIPFLLQTDAQKAE